MRTISCWRCGLLAHVASKVSRLHTYLGGHACPGRHFDLKGACHVYDIPLEVRPALLSMLSSL